MWVVVVDFLGPVRHWRSCDHPLFLNLSVQLSSRYLCKPARRQAFSGFAVFYLCMNEKGKREG